MLLTPLLSLLAPHDCLGCNREGALICTDCRQSLRPGINRCYRCHAISSNWLTCALCKPQSGLHAVFAAVRYESLAKDLVWRLKFGRAKAAAYEIAEIMSSSLCRLDMSHILVTHAPTATNRVRQRGYDQAALIAKTLAARTGATYVPLLARQNRSEQIGASQTARAHQLQDAFRPIHASKIRGTTILVVDDVITTGATLEAAATTLKSAGANRVIGAVFAQA